MYTYTYTYTYTEEYLPMTMSVYLSSKGVVTPVCLSKISLLVSMIIFD